ncbi:rhodanese-like domain-containing protein [Aestuariibacter halophilus]|uniref:Rhodanese-like domain-containing protein n=1 Tax=Fluctibacter halophilus TaxID=226011 RepID=A0ABS8GA22_9ALTE|nr:rhodanese-like domain-containing protein [Aestuariibacter halophilus]MCC2617437.1 rhodanese-like domain-containing protein [Aestuariibacter halophilus]
MKTVFLLLFLSLAGLAHGQTEHEISAQTLLQAPADYQIVDVRSAEEYAQGHVPGAINLPHDQIAELAQAQLVASGKPVVLYCRSGRRAQLAAEALQALGYDNLLHLSGDMQGWQDAGHPTQP